MRTRTITSFLLAVASIALISSCGHSGWQTDSKTGVVYQFIKHDDNGTKGTDSDYAKVILAFSMKSKAGKDSDVFDSRKRGDSTGQLTLSLKKTYHACLEDGLELMSPGDSAEFQINADSLYLKYFKYPPQRIPPGVTGTTIYTFRIKLKSIMTKKDIMEESNKQRQKYMEKMMALKATEAPAIASYLTSHHYENVKPTADSIFILEDTKGRGRQIKEGDSLDVGYLGSLLNGIGFDSSNRAPGHSTYKILYKKNAPLIKGWLTILPTLHEGEKVKVLIPSAMAYGPQGGGPIPPFSPLVFDMTIVKVKSN